MKKFGKILTLFIIIFLLAVSPVFSQIDIPSLEDLTDVVDGFSSSISKALPFNSTMGLNWSDAYIGKLIGVPPHFGIGLSFGATSMKIGSISGLANMLGIEMPANLPLGFPLPGYTVEARIGGFILPFDVGIKFGYMNMHTASVPVVNSLGMDVAIKYQLMGADIRYAIIDSKVMPIKLSVGAGINRLEGGLSTTVKNMGKEFSFDNPVTESESTLSFSDPDLGLLWETTCVELKVHVSFPILIVTPYAGLGASWAWSKAGYRVKTDIEVDGKPITDDVYDAIKELGVTGISQNGFESMQDVESFNLRFFAGISFNLAMIRIDITGMYNILDTGFGVTFGLRFQL